MRKRPNINWITEIRKLPTNCSDCWKLMFGWVCTYEIESEYLSCEDCFEKWGWPENWHYMTIEEYSKDTELKFFRDEASIDNYNERLYDN